MSDEGQRQKDGLTEKMMDRQMIGATRGRTLGSQRTGSCSGPAPALLAFYRGPARFLLQSCWHPARLLPWGTSRKTMKNGRRSSNPADNRKPQEKNARPHARKSRQQAGPSRSTPCASCLGRGRAGGKGRKARRASGPACRALRHRRRSSRTTPVSPATRGRSAPQSCPAPRTASPSSGRSRRCDGRG